MYIIIFICKRIIINKKFSTKIYKPHCIANNKINYFSYLLFIVPYIDIKKKNTKSTFFHNQLYNY